MEASRASARSVLAALRRHRWAAGFLMTGSHIRPAGLRDQHMEDGPHREVSAFGVGLDLILAGLQRKLTAPRADGA